MYTPGVIPNDCPPALAAWLAEQLRRISNELNDLPFVKPQGVEPPRPRDGLVAYALDPWAATLSGPGFYGYESGVWVKL